MVIICQNARNIQYTKVLRKSKLMQFRLGGQFPVRCRHESEALAVAGALSATAQTTNIILQTDFDGDAG